MRDVSRDRYFIVSGQSVRLSTVVHTLAPGDSNALRDGRVFIDGQRADESVRDVRPGSQVTWYAARPVTSAIGDLEFRILDRRNNLVIVAKPAHWSSEPDRSGRQMSLQEQVSRRLNLRNLHVATRLDAGVSGLVIIAIGEAACQFCSNLQSRRMINKDYLAIALGDVTENVRWDTPVDGKKIALTVCHRLAISGPVRFSRDDVTAASLLRLEASTGRHHQIRIHTSTNGNPLLGDRRYGGPMQYVRSDGTVRTIVRPMLHAWRLSIPWEDGDWTTVCPLPDDMRNLWADLGGRDLWPES